LKKLLEALHHKTQQVVQKCTKIYFLGSMFNIRNQR